MSHRVFASIALLLGSAAAPAQDIPLTPTAQASGAVITRDKAVGRTIARRLHAGTVNVNEAYGPSWGSTRAPMGGMGDSGLGRRHGDEGLLKYTESQTIATQRFLGFGPQFGWSDERWMNTMATTFKAFKAIGLK